jgi:hypothetical protein
MRRGTLRDVASELEFGDKSAAPDLPRSIDEGYVADHQVTRNDLELEPFRNETAQVGAKIYR